MHMWGDPNVDWAGISAAAEFIATRLRRWGRVPVRDYKEKYGTVRVYCSLGWYQLHDVTHPGYAYSQYPAWLWRLDCTVGPWIMRAVNWLVVPYHKWLYRRVYKAAVKRWPHLTAEILLVADHDHLLRGLEEE